MVCMRIAASGAALAIAAAAPGIAAAAGPSVNGSAFVGGRDGGSAQLSALGSAGFGGGIGAFASVNAYGSPTPYVLARAYAGQDASSAASASVTMSYSFFFTADVALADSLDHLIDTYYGDPLDRRLPEIGVRGSVFLQTPFDGSASAHVDGGTKSGEYAQFGCSAYGGGTDCGWSDFNILAAVNHVGMFGDRMYGGTFSLYASADDFEGGGGGEAPAEGEEEGPLGAIAYVDPQFFFDGHPEITFTLSDGIENTTGGHNLPFGPHIGGGGVPEPAAWALMIAGFGVAGAALRRRRRTADA